MMMRCERHACSPNRLLPCGISTSPPLFRPQVHLNVDSVTQMTSVVLPGMLERKKGAIVNIASAAGRLPTGNPFYAGECSEGS